MHESANVSYPFERIKEGNVISIGNPRVKVLHTPGHTPGLSSVPISTIGYEKRFNGAIDALSDKQKFIDYIKGLKTMEIPGYHKIKRINMDKQKN